MSKAYFFSNSVVELIVNSKKSVCFSCAGTWQETHTIAHMYINVSKSSCHHLITSEMREHFVGTHEIFVEIGSRIFSQQVGSTEFRPLYIGAQPVLPQTGPGSHSTLSNILLAMIK